MKGCFDMKEEAYLLQIISMACLPITNLLEVWQYSRITGERLRLKARGKEA